MLWSSTAVSSAVETLSATLRRSRQEANRTWPWIASFGPRRTEMTHILAGGLAWWSPAGWQAHWCRAQTAPRHRAQLRVEFAQAGQPAHGDVGGAAAPDIGDGDRKRLRRQLDGRRRRTADAELELGPVDDLHGRAHRRVVALARFAAPVAGIDGDGGRRLLA